MVTLFTSLLQAYIETFSNNCRFISCNYIKIAKLIIPLTAKEAAQALLNTTQSGTGCALVEPIWFPMPTLAPHSPDRAYNSKRIFSSHDSEAHDAFKWHLTSIWHTYYRMSKKRSMVISYDTITIHFFYSVIIFLQKMNEKYEQSHACAFQQKRSRLQFFRYVWAGFPDTKT